MRPCTTAGEREGDARSAVERAAAEHRAAVDAIDQLRLGAHEEEAGPHRVT